MTESKKTEQSAIRTTKKIRKPTVNSKLASGKIVGAVANAVTLLRYLGKTQRPVGVTRIAKETGINTSTCFNILKTLAVEDLVAFDKMSKTYTISFGILDITRNSFGDIISNIKGPMEGLARENGITITLWKPISGKRKVLLLCAQSNNAMQILMPIGQRVPILLGASGRCFAAFSKMTDQTIKEQFRDLRWGRKFNYSQFRKQVKETAENGWALDEGFFAPGTVSVSTPILDDDGHAIMAVTAAMFAGQYSANFRDHVVAELKEFCQRIRPAVIDS